MMERLQNWTMRFINTPYSSLVLFLVSFAESSFFPIPPDPFLMILSVIKPEKWWWYAFLTAFASVLGAIFAYFVGFAFYETVGRVVIETYGLESAVREVGARYDAHSFLAVFGAAFTPIPFKVFTISAGLFKINLTSMVFASILGRGIRFFVVAGVMYLFGIKAEEFIKKYFGVLSLLFFGILILGFVAIVYLL